MSEHRSGESGTGVPRRKCGGVAALERGLSLLTAFRGSEGTLSLAELAQRTRMYKSTILRLCVSLEREGFLSRQEKGQYRLGAVVYELGAIYRQAFHLEPYVMPVLRDLEIASGESASFYVREEEYRVCLHRVDSSQAIREAHVRAGDRFPLTGSSATVLVLRAFCGEAGEELDRVRAQGEAASFGAHSPDTAAVAFPVFGEMNRFLGAISISGPRVRFTEEAVASMREQLSEASAELSRSLGARQLPAREARA